MSKNIIICADGTWSDEDLGGAATNVAKLHRDLQTHYVEGVPQWVFYHSGVGTTWWSWLPGGAFGLGINRNIKECYEYLVDHYEDGDNLYFFGFSRGAYTVRSLAGLVRNSGIVKRRELVHKAFALYRSRKENDEPSKAGACQFRREHAKEIVRSAHNPGAVEYVNSPKIEFIGVWDTVGALGYPFPFLTALKPFLAAFGANWWFHDTKLSTTVSFAYHALAIHERRSDFTPTLWKRQVNLNNTIVRPDQVLEQVYFTGTHGDVGGGYGGGALSDVAYRWMVEKAAGAGLLFRSHARDPNGGLAPDPLGRLHDSFTGAFVLADAVRCKPHGEPRIFESGPLCSTKIADSAVERANREVSTLWPVRGGEYSFAEQIRLLQKGGSGTRAEPVLVLLKPTRP